MTIEQPTFVQSFYNLANNLTIQYDVTSVVELLPEFFYAWNLQETLFYRHRSPKLLEAGKPLYSRRIFKFMLRFVAFRLRF